MTDKITSFIQLRTWQNARELAVNMYKTTAIFPASEKFGITSQIQRSSVSVAGNIAEGFSRSGRKDKTKFYVVALGSLTETLSHLYISCDLGFITPKQLNLVEQDIMDIHKMINGLIKSATERNP